MLIGWKPNENNGFETFGAGKISGDPDLFECGEEFGLLVLWFWTGFTLYLFASYDFEVSESADGVLAVELAVGTKLIQDLGLFGFGRCFCVT